MRTIALVLPLFLMVPVSGAQVQWMVLTANKASTCSVQAHPGEQVLGCYSLDTEVLQSLASSARKGGSLEVPHPSGSFKVVEWEAETYENGAVSVHGRPAGQPHATFQLTALGRTAIGEYQLGDRFYELRPLREGGAVRGTGLGLHIVSRIMALYGGEVQIERREGGGSIVKLMFPITDGTQCS